MYYVHQLDPIALDLGFLAIRWYSLAYILGILFAWQWIKYLINHHGNSCINHMHIENFLPYCIISIIVGGRLGHVLFYYPNYYLYNFQEIFYIWEGGVAFHGGLLGMIIMTILYAYIHKLPLGNLLDYWAAGAPMGIFFVRFANFVNGELWGKPTTVPWAVIFPFVDDLPRHPVQLYEAVSEGLVLFIIITLSIIFFKALHKKWLLTGMFFTLYAIARIISEFYKEEEVFVNILPFGISYGQLLCLPMFILGISLIYYAFKCQKISHKI